MADNEKSLQERKEDLEFEISYEKKAKKVLLICTAICGGIGLVGGLIGGISSGGVEYILGGFFGGIWFGTGLGGAISLVPLFFRHQNAAHERGEEAEDRAIWINLILFFFLFFVGPLGLLVRILRINHRIKGFEEELKQLG